MYRSHIGNSALYLHPYHSQHSQHPRPISLWQGNHTHCDVLGYCGINQRVYSGICCPCRSLSNPYDCPYLLEHPLPASPSSH